MTKAAKEMFEAIFYIEDMELDLKGTKGSEAYVYTVKNKASAATNNVSFYGYGSTIPEAVADFRRDVQRYHAEMSQKHEEYMAVLMRFIGFTAGTEGR